MVRPYPASVLLSLTTSKALGKSSRDHCILRISLFRIPAFTARFRKCPRQIACHIGEKQFQGHARTSTIEKLKPLKEVGARVRVGVMTQGTETRVPDLGPSVR